MSDTKNEMNLLVHRYLEESGFAHSAYLFSCEAKIGQSDSEHTNVPPGALISIVQKGVKYVEAERTAADNNVERAIDGLSLLKAVSEFKTTDSVLSRVWNYICWAIGIANYQSQQTAVTSSSTRAGTPPLFASSRDSTSTDDILAVTETIVPTLASTDSQQNMSGDIESADQMPTSRVTTLHSSQSEYVTCAWNPHPCNNILASYSGDSTVRIWNVDDPTRDASLRYSIAQEGVNVPSFEEVMSLDWNRNGSFLAAGCKDGFARIWTASGRLVSTLRKVRGHFIDLKWNKRGNFLLSADSDQAVSVWDLSTGTIRQKFTLTNAHVWSIDWQSDNTFATSCSDNLIYNFKLDLVQPVRIFSGHTCDVLIIKWCPSGDLLASGSDDLTLKVWSQELDTPVLTFLGHTDSIPTIDWSNTGLRLASGSYDSTVRLWDIETGSSMHTPKRHDGPVNSVAFSPDGHFLASGSADKRINIWSTETGQLVNWYETSGGVSKVHWSANDNMIGASVDNGTVIVLDMRK